MDTLAADTTLPDAAVLADYRSGLTIQIQKLGELLEQSRQQHVAIRQSEVELLAAATQRRETVMAELRGLEERLAPVRSGIAAALHRFRHAVGFEAASGLHQQAALLLNQILEEDEAIRGALASSDATRRCDVQTLDAAGATLAAYRRIVAPPTPSAALVNRRG